MAGFGAASIFLKIGLIVSILGFLFHLVGLATPYWTSEEKTTNLPIGGTVTTKRIGHGGLWKWCNSIQDDPTDLTALEKLIPNFVAKQGKPESTDEITCRNNKIVTAWLETCQAFAILGVLASLVGLFVLILNFFVEKPHIDTGAMLASCVSAGCIFLCIVIYGAKRPVDLSWSFALSIIGMLLEGVTATLLFINKLREGGVAAS